MVEMSMEKAMRGSIMREFLDTKEVSNPFGEKVRTKSLQS
jgi:hypothetical protein